MRFLNLLFVSLVFLAVSSRVLADNEFKTDYSVDYYPRVENGEITTAVTFTTTITNLQDNLYVDNYGLSFPASFDITNISASDQKGAVTTSVQKDEENVSVKMKLNTQNVGNNAKTILVLKFDQAKLFEIDGNVWEVMLPTITGREGGSYSVRVHLPPGNKQIAIAKPKPTSIQNGVISWDNPSVKTIYAVFGDRQYYSLDLSYHLANEKVIPIYTEVAFPPDTLHQKIYLESVTPKPNSIRVDSDGNYLARYDINPKQKMTIRYKGAAEVFAQPRDELRALTKKQFEKQKSYLLKESQYWTISNPASYKHLNTPEAVYKSVVGSLSYDYERLSDNKSYRLGADTALKNPTKAVCVEFTDTFIALSRSNGIHSREIQGFGFSQDEKLRPLSLISDVLHAWPEYYDEQTGLWNQVDPTWESTSGIDYFSSFDLDHIAFAIHGRDPEDPPPAGTYKYEESRDVHVSAESKLPAEEQRISLRHFTVANVVTDRRTYNGSVDVTNDGNTTLYNVPLAFTSGAFNVLPQQTSIEQLPPLATQKVSFSYSLNTSYKNNEGSIAISAGDSAMTSRTIRITPLVYTLTIVIGAIVAIILLVLLALFTVHKKKRHVGRV